MTRADKKPAHILITGASSGIGAALAKAYGAPGVMLTLTGRNEERLGDITALCEKAGASVNRAAIDVTDQKALSAFLIETDTKNPVDLVIANAGISAGTGGCASGEPIDQARRIFDVNLTGTLNTIEPLLPKMIQRGGGQIALMSSLAGFLGWPGAPAYCGSKAAVKVYGESLRGSLKDAGIKVSVICPGFVDTRMSAANDFPMPFLMTPERAAGLIIRGLEKNKGRICFPLRAYFIIRLLGALPESLAQTVLKPMPAKKPGP